MWAKIQEWGALECKLVFKEKVFVMLKTFMLNYVKKIKYIPMHVSFCFEFMNGVHNLEINL